MAQKYTYDQILLILYLTEIKRRFGDPDTQEWAELVARTGISKAPEQIPLVKNISVVFAHAKSDVLLAKNTALSRSFPGSLKNLIDSIEIDKSDVLERQKETISLLSILPHSDLPEFDKPKAELAQKLANGIWAEIEKIRQSCAQDFSEKLHDGAIIAYALNHQSISLERNLIPKNAWNLLEFIPPDSAVGGTRQYSKLLFRYSKKKEKEDAKIPSVTQLIQKMVIQDLGRGKTFFGSLYPVADEYEQRISLKYPAVKAYRGYAVDRP